MRIQPDSFPLIHSHPRLKEFPFPSVLITFCPLKSRSYLTDNPVPTSCHSLQHHQMKNRSMDQLLYTILLIHYLLAECYCARRASSKSPDIIIITTQSNPVQQPNDQKHGPSPSSQNIPPSQIAAPPHTMFPEAAFDQMRMAAEDQFVPHGPQMQHPPISVSMPPAFMPSMDGPTSLAVAAAATSLMMRDLMDSRRRAMIQQRADSDDMIDSSATASDQQLMIEEPTNKIASAVERWRAAAQYQQPVTRSPFMQQ